MLLLSGLTMAMMGVFRLGQFITVVPNVVISGFMDGIALLIWQDQVRIMVRTCHLAPFTGSFESKSDGNCGSQFGLGRAGLAGPLWANLLLLGLTTVFCFLLPWAARKVCSERVARLTPWTLIILVLMSALALVLPDIQMTEVATLDSFADVADIFERNFPDQWSWPLLFQTQVRDALLRQSSFSAILTAAGSSSAIQRLYLALF